MMELNPDTLSDDGRAILMAMTRSSWTETGDSYRNRDLDGILSLYAPDAISIPASHRALRGHADIRDWYGKRSTAYPTFIESRPDSIDIVGDLAIVTGVFRACRPAEQGVAGLDHGGRYLAVLRKVDGQWKLWRDMDTPSPDADIFYTRLSRDV